MHGKREASTEQAGGRISPFTFLGFLALGGYCLLIKDGWDFGTLHSFGSSPGCILSLENSVSGPQSCKKWPCL